MKKAIMTKKELNEKLLHRTPHSGFHHYDGFLFIASLLAYRRSKKRERMEKSRMKSEPDFNQSVQSSKYEESLYIF